MKQPFIIKNETLEVIQLQKELDNLLAAYERHEVSYNECVGVGMKLCLKILQGATKNDI